MNTKKSGGKFWNFQKFPLFLCHIINVVSDNLGCFFTEAEIIPIEPGQVMLLRKVHPRIILLYMKILINNEQTETMSANVQALANELALPERGVALAVNNKIVPRATWAEAAIKEGDSVTIIKAAFGG